MFFNFIEVLSNFISSKNVKKFNKGKNGIDFSSNIDNAKKAIAKVLNHRIDNLSTLLQTTETQSNVTNRKEISIERDNACSSPIKVKSLLIVQKSNRFKVNSSIRKHKCKTCNKRFPSQSHLKIHIRVHSKQKPFTCDQCQMTFSRKGNLTIHQRTHSGEKPYQCDLCEKKFAQSIHLIVHRRTHTGERPYSCNLCPSKFAQSNDLTKHKRIHSRKRPNRN